MGGGDDVPTSPDYQPILDMAMDMAGYNLKFSRSQQDFFKKLFLDNKGVADKFTGAMLDQMGTWLDEADNQLERYHKYGHPLEESLYQQALDMQRPEWQEYEAGKAAAEEAQKFAAARDTAMQRLESFGIDPSQTRAQALDLGTRVAEGAAQAGAANVARDQARDRAIALRKEAIDTARGGVQLGQQAASLGAQAGNQAVNAGLATAASAADTLGTGPTWAQLANQGLGTATDIKNTQFQNDMDRYKAEQEASSGWGGVVGSALGLATKFLPGFAAGGAIPEEMSPSGGAQVDDVPAQIVDQNGAPSGEARLNAGEFVIPEDVARWLGEQQLQKLILKSRKEMTGENGERPAQPQEGPPEPSIPQYAAARGGVIPEDALRLTMGG